MPSTLDWLNGRDDAALVALLTRRVDLTVPAPAEMSVLARRVDAPPSVFRALEQLNRFHLQVLAAVAVTGGRGPAPRAAVLDLLGPAHAAAATAALAELETLALVRGTEAPALAPSVLTSLGEFPAGLGPRGTLDEAAVRTALDDLDPAARGVLERLDQGRPRGTVPRSGATARLAESLVTAGLLLAPEPGTVLLPREVSFVLRGDAPLGPIHPTAPVAAATRGGDVDGTAAGQAVGTVAVARAVLGALGRTPVPALKAGGMGVREIRRLAKDLGVAEPVLGLHLEMLAAAGLMAGADWIRGDPAWTPTAAADAFLDAPDEQAWAELAAAWLELRSDPARIGRRDETTNKVVAALSFETTWTRGPADRRLVLAALADLPAGTGVGPADLTERLTWQLPMRTEAWLTQVAATTVEQATTLGLVAFGALSTAGRAVLAGGGAAAALERALPAPVEDLLVQADLTVVAPGRLTRDLERRLGAVADVESAGGAAVYRVTPESLRRGLDGGATAAEVHALFREHSRTGVPQALDYLIDDVARRHGSLRVGGAGAYLRSDDPGLVDAAVAQLRNVRIPVRRLAPTVAVSDLAVEDLFDALRRGGLVPAAEDAGGAVISLGAPPARARRPDARQQAAAPAPARPSVEQLTALVGRLRTAAPVAEQSAVDTLDRLREAAETRAGVWIGYAGSDGGSVRRMIEPVAVSGGTVVAFDHLRQSMQTFALHRITGVGELVPGQSVDPGL